MTGCATRSAKPLRHTRSTPTAALHSVKARGANVTDTTSDDAVVPVALEDVAGPRRRPVRAQRLVAVAAAIAVLAAGIAIPFALRDRSHDTAHKVKVHTPKQLTTKPGNSRIALNAVAAAVNATTSSGSFRVSYTLDETPGTAPTTTTCAHISVPRRPERSRLAAHDAIRHAGHHVLSRRLVHSSRPPAPPR